MYIDDDGVLHFTNTPTSSNYRLYIKENPLASVAPVTRNQFDQFITEASIRHGVSFPLLKALIKTESDFNPRAVSKAGAMGLMQIMPQNVKAFDMEDPFDPWENIMAGTNYLKKLLEQFEGKLPLALAAYNAGPNLVARHKRIPPFPETERFVKKVMEYYHIYKNKKI